MRERTRRATALGASAFILAGSAALAMPGTAAATETKTAPCGGSVTAKTGDTILGKTPLLGIPLNLGQAGPVSGVLTGTINALLGTVCKVTVTVVNTVVAPVPVVGAPAAEALNGAVSGTHEALTGGGAKPAPGTQPQPGKPAPGTPGSGGPQTGGPGAPAQGGAPAGGIPAANSPLLPGTFTPNFGGLPWGISTGYAPMRDYSSIPMATAGLFSPSPGLRYGGQIPGYAPQFGIETENQAGNPDVQNAGQAEALPSVSDGFTQDGKLPLLIAVLALSGVSAGLVRTWVLRRMAATS
ncbi:hypothetical protein [Amycolatopsis keratiniphila]|uniref:hypothetical protein n=1 Tax=Amycolatopsis keratiniphila TaxID=129921 RepID=UPI00087BEC4D|nr:hypothetical protein [Amycolatopsis keratiniphila]OLZ59973.1 hypothetical protein BS330_06415 [Amycolatopsis keratiniphila subsp. nogabecina]SDU56651.1 hypothetical protein SAMN04489733_6198 [Amycolatopsis keratiniphila]